MDEICPTCKQSGHRIEDCEKNENLRFQKFSHDPTLSFNKIAIFNPSGEGKSLRVRFTRNLKKLREILENLDG